MVRVGIQKLKQATTYVRTWFPSSLPHGVEAFDAFAESVIQIYKLPDLPSYRHAIATMILHLGPTTASKSKRYFALSIQKAMANQVAYQKIQDFKALEEAKSKTDAAAENEGTQGPAKALVSEA